MTESAVCVAHSRCSVIVNSLPTISLLCAGCGTAGGVGVEKPRPGCRELGSAPGWALIDGLSLSGILTSGSQSTFHLLNDDLGLGGPAPDAKVLFSENKKCCYLEE